MPRRTSTSPRADVDALRTRVAALEAELTSLRAERDHALAELAHARAAHSALRLLLQREDTPEPPRFPAGTSTDAPPLRYRVADTVNDSLKSLLGPLYGAGRSLVSRLDR